MEKHTPDEIFGKTFGFVFLKMLIPIASLVVSLIAMATISAIGGHKLGIIGAIIWAVITVVAYFAINLFLGYKGKAGHVAVVMDAVSFDIPDEMFKTAKESVSYRFPSCNEYSSYERQMKGVIAQLQKHLNTFPERHMRKPVVAQLLQLLQVFIGMALGFASDLCLGYTFWRDGKPLNTSAADGAAIYYLCWRRIVENAIVLAVEIIVGMVVLFAFLFCIFAPILTANFGSVLAGGLGAVALGFFVCKAVKCFIDSKLMVTTMIPYFEEAQYVELNEDDYAAACEASPKFRVLYQKAMSEAANPVPANR